jgi:multidrug efflux pump subunit AcrA (membrane-fusion protein)
VRTAKGDEQRQVSIGLRGDDSVEIVSGVSEGDVVVTKVVTNTGGGATTGAQLGRGGRVGAGGGAFVVGGS